MPTTAPSYQTLLTTKDKSFLEKPATGLYSLTLCIGDTDMGICCIEQTTHRCRLLETYSLAAPNTSVTALKKLYKQQPWLATTTWGHVMLCVKNRHYTLVPHELFVAECADSYLQWAAPVDDTIQVTYLPHHRLDVAVAFGLPKPLMAWFNKVYKNRNVCIMHQSSSLLASVFGYLAAEPNTDLPQLFVFVDGSYMHVLCVAGHRLLYCNQFCCDAMERAVRYVLIVIHTLGLPVDTTAVTLMGSVKKNAWLHAKLSSYLPMVVVKNMTRHVKCSRSIPKTVAMEHPDLLSAHLHTQFL